MLKYLNYIFRADCAIFIFEKKMQKKVKKKKIDFPQKTFLVVKNRIWEEKKTLT